MFEPNHLNIGNYKKYLKQKFNNRDKKIIQY